jgi:hypothetical protein
MTTPDEDTQRKVPSRRFRITHKHYCWCGRGAGLVVESLKGVEVEWVCTEDHGRQVIHWIGTGVVPFDKATIAAKVED